MLRVQLRKQTKGSEQVLAPLIKLIIVKHRLPGHPLLELANGYSWYAVTTYVFIKL